DVGLGHLSGQQPSLAAVAAEDVAEPGGDDDLEAVLLERPDGVLPARPGAEVRAGHQHRAPGIRGGVQHERGVLAPAGEAPVLEAGAADPLQEVRRDDLVGVDIAATQRDPDASVGAEPLHQADTSSCVTAGVCRAAGSVAPAGSSRSVGEDSVPRTAVAAATAGLTRWVRERAP